jgi:hypothetical protein
VHHVRLPPRSHWETVHFKTVEKNLVTSYRNRS